MYYAQLRRRYWIGRSSGSDGIVQVFQTYQRTLLVLLIVILLVNHSVSYLRAKYDARQFSAYR